MFLIHIYTKIRKFKTKLPTYSVILTNSAKVSNKINNALRVAEKGMAYYNSLCVSIPLKRSAYDQNIEKQRIHSKHCSTG